MKELFDEKHLEKVASAWLGGNDCTSEILESQYCLSQLMMKGRSSSKVTYFVSWRNWTDRILFNVIQTTIAKNFLKKGRQEMDRYVSLCNDLVCRFSPVHAEIYDFTRSIPCTATESMLIPDDLSVRCPALKWRTYFGSPYINLLGKETILNAPCWKTEEIGDTIAIQLTESVFEDIPSELREKVVEYFEESVDPKIRAELGRGFFPVHIMPQKNMTGKRNWFRNFQSENCSERIFQRSLNMDYEQFITEIQKYWDLRKKGLKKQANSFLFTFTKSFKENVPDEDADAILFQFCREYLDEMKFPGDKLPRRHLPFQITELLDSYLKCECEKDKMPQMRWAYQIFGNRYNPHDPMLEHDLYPILKRAYMHEKCDPQTAQLYFREQIESLWWGQHHFPESCLITKDDFENIVGAAKKILSEKTVEPQLVEEFEYYVKLYQIYFEWQNNNRNGDFYELCKKEGLAFEGIPVIYYKE